MKETAVEAVKEPGTQDGSEGGPHPREIEVWDLGWVQDSPLGGVASLTDSEWNSDEYISKVHPK